MNTNPLPTKRNLTLVSDSLRKKYFMPAVGLRQVVFTHQRGMKEDPVLKLFEELHILNDHI